MVDEAEQKICRWAARWISQNQGQRIQKSKNMTWISFMLFQNHHVGSHHCAVSSSFVCSADFLMRGFWRRMTERSGCSVGEEGHLKEMSNALSMDTPNTSLPPTQMPCWQLGSTIRTEKGGISLKLSLCQIL